jgi:hypothetical protein
VKGFRVIEHNINREYATLLTFTVLFSSPTLSWTLKAKQILANLQCCHFDKIELHFCCSESKLPSCPSFRCLCTPSSSYSNKIENQIPRISLRLHLINTFTSFTITTQITISLSQHKTLFHYHNTNH